MKYFLDTVETIDLNRGFTLYDSTHLAWIGIFVLFAIISSIFYKKANDFKREKIRNIFAIFLIINELFKTVMLFIGGNYLLDYLPLHLCSINIFIIAYHTRKPNKTIDSFLYLICIPAAIAAILFPTWVELPVLNFMHLHSFTIHILLATYPIMLFVGKDIVPEKKYLIKSVGFALTMMVPIYVINLILDTNFMFLMYAESGNPLYWFQEKFGNHLIGLPPLVILVMIIMYGISKISRFKKEISN